MFIRTIISLLFLMALCVSAALAQGADERVPSLFSRHREDDVPKNVLETREKLRIEKEKKDFQEMMDRGEEVLKLTERVEKAFTANGRFSDMELSNIESVEKDVKKIRSDLGGNDDDENLDDVIGDKQPTIAEAVASLKTTTSALYNELKKTTRFSISAAAIESSNAVLKIVKFLRSGK